MSSLPTKISGLLLTLFLTASCSSKSRVSEEEYNNLLQKNTSLTNEIAGHHRLARLLQREQENPAVEAVKTGAVLLMFAKREPAFKEALLDILAEYGISGQDLEKRKALSDAIEHVKDTPEFDCVRIDNWRHYQEGDEAEAPKSYQGVYPEDYREGDQGVVYEEDQKHLICY
jgi:hypothetical protein